MHGSLPITPLEAGEAAETKLIWLLVRADERCESVQKEEGSWSSEKHRFYIELLSCCFHIALYFV